ncbi:MAG: peptidoglycan DD-metalloendopeptidase family protein, partial [Pyrinomonadaceae bacterium]
MKLNQKLITFFCGGLLCFALFYEWPTSAKTAQKQFSPVASDSGRSVQLNRDIDFKVMSQLTPKGTAYSSSLAAVDKKDDLKLFSFLGATREGNDVSVSSGSPSYEVSHEKSNPRNKSAVASTFQIEVTPSFVGADNGQAFIYDENSGTSQHLRTSMPVFKAFGISLKDNSLLYSPLKNRIPSGQLFLENLKDGKATRITDDLVLEAAFSPDESKVAYTFATGSGFGLAIVDLDSEQRKELISERVLPDFFQWGSSGKEIYYFETTDESNTTGVVPHEITVKNKESKEMTQDSLPSGFPKLSPESNYLNPSSKEISSTHSEIHYPFQIVSPDKTKRVCGDNLFGNTSIQLCENNLLNQSYLSEGQLLRVTNEGIIIRSFEENRTTTDFVDWNGNKSRLAASPQVSYNLPMSATSPNSGSFLVTRSGTGYSNACTLVGSLHTGNLQFAFDMQKGGNNTPGQHVIASAEGLVVESVRTINCNSCDTEVGGCGGMPHCTTSQANGGWGNSVVIQHADTTWSRYAHMQFNSVTVQNGDTVCQGLYIGNQGGTGTSCGDFNGCGDHLHFQKQNSSGVSISASFSDVANNPLSCINYTTGSTEVSTCSTCQNGTSTLRNRDGGPPIHPPGSVVKTASNSTVYLIDSDNRKRPITSSSVLAQLYNQSTDARTSTNFTNWVITVGQDELDLYEQGGNLSAALAGNGQPFPDGKLIGLNGEVSIVTGGGKRRAFASSSTFTGLGFNFCQVVNVSQTEYNSYPAGPAVDAMPLLTSSVNVSLGPYIIGQNITGSFTIENVGYAAIPFSNLGIGGRLNGTTVYDMNFVSTTLAPGSSYTYISQPRQLTSAGTYDFFAAYQESNGHWALSVPAAPGVIRSRQITVGTGTPPPSNDNFANAQAISGTLGTVTGTNVGATKESGEPNHAGNTGGASVWYRWQPSSSGSATFATNGSNFDTLLAVYTGSSVSGLT